MAPLTAVVTNAGRAGTFGSADGWRDRETIE